MPEPVWKSIETYLNTEANYGGYETAALFQDDFDKAYLHLAALIGAKPVEIAITGSASQSWQRVFFSFKWKEGDEIITSLVEYGSNFIGFLQVEKEFGVKVKIAPSIATGEIDPKGLRALITPHTRLIAITHMPTHSGLINPAAEIGAIAKEYGIPYLLDACQTVGQMPLDVEAIGCDFLSATGRKFLRGPRGTGFLYVKESWISKLEPNSLDLYSADWLSRNDYQPHLTAKRFEQFEQFMAGKRALGVAADYALSIGLDRIWERVKLLRDYLEAQLLTLPGLEVDHQGARPGGILTFRVPGLNSQEIMHNLRIRGVNVSVTRDGGALLDFKARALPESVRASVLYYNTEGEIDKMIDYLRPVLKNGKGL